MRAGSAARSVQDYNGSPGLDRGEFTLSSSDGCLLRLPGGALGVAQLQHGAAWAPLALAGEAWSLLESAGVERSECVQVVTSAPWSPWPQLEQHISQLSRPATPRHAPPYGAVPWPMAVLALSLGRQLAWRQ